MIPKMQMVRNGRYKIYLEGAKKGKPTKAEMSRRGLQEALKLGSHDEKKICDFIPIEFSIQYHAWGNFKFNTFPAIRAFIKRHINEPDLEKKLGGKGHFDLRHQKLKAPCTDEDTELLTENGWKHFRDLSPEEKVAQLNNGKLEYVKPLGIWKFDYEGEMIEIEAEQINFSITPEHRCYFQRKRWFREKGNYEKRHWKFDNYKLITAEKIYQKTGRFNKVSPQWKGRLSNKNWYEFLGFWFAEGSAWGDTKRGYALTLSQKKEVSYVEDLLRRNELTATIKIDKRNNCKTWTIRGKERALRFKKYGDTYTKAIPKEIKFADRDSLRAFIEGYSRGDGCKTKDSWRLYTVSKQLADDLQEIALKAGYVANMRMKIDGRNSVRVPIYEITILRRYGHKPFVFAHHWKKRWYKGKVYSISVPSEIVLLRRHGLYHWSGNSWFGITVYHKAPWQGTAADKSLGSFKGVMQLTAPGRELRAAIKKEHGFTPKGLVTMESGEPKWMDAEYYIPPGKAATTNKWPEVMVLIEHRMPGVLHRRDFDFMDITYLGKYMKGGYYWRLVTRDLKPEEMPKTYKKKTKTNVYGWRAKTQFPEALMKQVASGKIRIAPRSLLKGR